MVRIAVCDDEELDCQTISGYVNDYLGSRKLSAKVDRYQDGKSLILAHKKRFYDIILLDIYMEGLSGIDTAKKLRDMKKECDLCFITTSSDHALESYRLKALDYLVKPVAPVDVEDFLSRCLRRIDDGMRYITVHVNHCPQHVLVKDILWINSTNHVTFLHTKNDVRKTWHSMQEYDEWLGGPPFYRINRSYLVNFDEVQRMEPDYLLMTDGSTIPLPLHHHYRQAAREMYRDYLSHSSRIGKVLL